MKIDTLRWHELSPFLDQAFELEGEARAAWVERFSREHPELLPDVQWILGQLQALDNEHFLQDDPKRGLLDPPRHEGRVLGNYTLESALGRGGMGSVWLARRSDGQFEGKVAIKLLNLALLESRGEQHFRREGRTLAKLAHPNIARILDAGVATGGQPYLVLEPVEGEPIDQYCDQRSLPVDARIKLFLDVLAAVGHAHANLIVHRDIKPSNIYVTHDGVVKLLDFGIAKLLDDDDTTGPGVNTREFGRALTPQYAAPEQVLGTPITVATDVYALGVLLYVLLSGRYPIGAKKNSSLQYFRLLLETEARRASDAASTPDESYPTTLAENAARRATTLPRLKRTLRGDLDNILARALRKVPQERYGSVQEFADDLGRYLRNEPVLARPASAWYRMRKFVARHRFPVAVAGIALVAVLATATIALFQAQRAAVEASRAATERDRALALSARNEAVAEFLGVLLNDAASSDKPITAQDLIQRSEALISIEYGNNPENRAAVLGMVSSYYNDNGDIARAESLLRAALDAIRNSPDADLRRRLTCEHAKLRAYLGQEAEAVRTLKEGVADAQATPTRRAECLSYLSQVAHYRQDGAAALDYAQRALVILRQDARHSPTMEAQFLGTLGDAQRLVGRNDLAGQSFERALAQLARAGRDKGSIAIVLRNNWAVVSLFAGEPSRTLQLEDENAALVTRRQPLTPLPTYLIANQALALEAMGRYREALERYSLCAELSAESAPSAHVICVAGQGSAARESGDLASAETYAERAAEAARSSAVSGSGVRAWRLLQTRIALSRGRLAEAREAVEAALETGGPPGAKATALLLRAELHLQEGKLAAAEADAREALDIARTAQGGIPHSNRTGLAALMLGRVLMAEGQQDRAHEAFQDAVAHLSSTVDEQHPMLKLARELANG